MFSRQTEGWDKWKWNWWFQVKNATISKVYFQNCLWQTYQTLLFKRNKFAYSDKNLNGPFYTIKPNPTSRVNIKLNKTSWTNLFYCFLNEFWNNFCFSDHTSENPKCTIIVWTFKLDSLTSSAIEESCQPLLMVGYGIIFESNCSGLELSTWKGLFTQNLLNLIFVKGWLDLGDFFANWIHNLTWKET